MTLESCQLVEIQGNPETLALLASFRRQLEMVCGPDLKEFIDAKIEEYRVILADRDEKFAQIQKETSDAARVLKCEADRSSMYAQADTSLALAGLAADGKVHQFQYAVTKDMQGSELGLATA